MSFATQLAKLNKQDNTNLKKEDLLSETAGDVIARQKAAQKKTAAKKTESVKKLVSGRDPAADMAALQKKAETEEVFSGRSVINEKGQVEKAGEQTIGKSIKELVGWDDIKDLGPAEIMAAFGVAHPGNMIAGSVGKLGKAGTGKALGSGLGKNGGWISSSTLKAAQKNAAIPKVGVLLDDATSTAGRILTNTKTIKQTTSMISKIATQLGKPKVVAGMIAAGIVSSIGSYPFSLFIKEEALQAIKGSYTGAMIQGNSEQAQIAMDERMEILNPGIAEKIISAVPIANSVKQLIDYFQTARTAAAIDQAILDDQKIAIENEESYEETDARIRANRQLDEMAMRDDYERRADERREKDRIAAEEERIASQEAWDESKAKQRELDAEARDRDIAARNKDAEEDAKKELEDAQALADLWLAYDKEKEKQYEDLRPSNLNFGLI